MVGLDGYLLTQKKNAIEISLPQTKETITSTRPVSDRREWLTTAQEAVLLLVVVQMLEGEE